MGYVEENLLPGEKIVYHASLHWILFLGPFLVLLVGLFIFIYAAAFSEGCGFLLSLMCVFVGLLAGLSSTVTYFTTEFGLTDKRIIAKDGLIRRRSIEMLLTQIESIGVNQAILGRILNYGTITVVGTGGTRERFKAIIDPMELRKQVHAQLTTIS